MQAQVWLFKTHLTIFPLSALCWVVVPNIHAICHVTHHEIDTRLLLADNYSSKLLCAENKLCSILEEALPQPDTVSAACILPNYL